MIDKSLARFILPYYVDMFQLLKRLGKDPRDTGNMYCPFHYNVNTPSAKMYHDETGWVVWCFNEKRIFTTYDVYEKIMGTDPMKFAMIIWNKLSPEQKQQMIDLSGSQQDFEGDVPYMDELNEFSEGKITYERLCDLMALKL